MSKPFKILSIDGGGIRGVFAAKILSLMETKLGMNIHEDFDLIVGTSTGSIIAGAIAIKYDLAQLVEDYSEKAHKIFQKRWNGGTLIRSKYNSQFLSSFLQEKLGDIKLGDIEKPFIFNATNASTGDVYIFKTSYQQKQRGGDYVRDSATPLYKAVLASCSAPIYFDPVDIDGTLVCDGGIWANNPALVGYVDAISNFQADNIKILSLGTGKTRQTYQPAKMWGFLTGWERTRLVDFAMSCQTVLPQNALNLMNPEAILRINPSIPDCPLDTYRRIPTFVELAKSEFTQNSAKIMQFLNQETTK